MRFVIIGGGIAGTTAAEEIRKQSVEAEIIIVSEEQHPLYSKVLLSHLVLEKIPREKVFIKTADWYYKNNIEYQYGVLVTIIDTVNQFIETSEQREIPYDKLLITTGGDAKLLLEDMRGVSYFRNLDDADQILSMIAELKTLPLKDRKAVVLGGAFIALEYINLLHHHKIEQTVVNQADGFWSKIIGDHAKQLICKELENKGVRLITGVQVEELQGEFELSAVLLSNGETLPAKFLGVGIGLDIDYNLFKEAQLEVGAGLCANEFLETNAKNVYTAGDVAEVKNIDLQKRLLVRNWQNAFLQGRLAGKNMLGEHLAFSQVTSYSAQLLDLKVVFIGDTDRKDTEVIQYLADVENSIEIFNRNGVTVGAVIVGGVSERQNITTAINNKQNYVA